MMKWGLYFILVFLFLVLASLVSALSFTMDTDVTPDSPFTTNNLYCEFDATADMTNNWIRWYNNSVLFRTKKNDANHKTRILSKYLSYEDNWTCIVEITNGSTTIFMNDSVKIDGVVGILGFLSDPDLTPDYPTTDEKLWCEFNPVDENVDNWISWYNNSVFYKRAKNDADHKTGVASSYTFDGDNWTCVVELGNFSDSIFKNDSIIVGSTEPPNNVPVIDSVEFNDVGDSGDENITLPYTGIHSVRCFGTASDADGNSKITNVNATFYSSSSSYSSSDDNSYHYSVSSCSYDYTTGNFECAVDFLNYAENGTWYCNATVTDDKADFGFDTDSVIVYSSPAPNNAPNITSVEFNELDDSGDNVITLSSVGRKSLRCFGYASDADGNADITLINATFYHSSSTSDALDDDSVHYSNSSCSYSTSNGFFECVVDVIYNATVGTWYCNATVIDGLGENDSLVDSVTINQGPPPDVSFTSSPTLTPNYPSTDDVLTCSWGQSSDTELAYVDWYYDGVFLKRHTVSNPPRSLYNTDYTSDDEEWYCEVQLVGGNATANATSNNVTIGSTPTNYEPVVDSIELNDRGDYGDGTMTLVAGDYIVADCFGTITDSDGNSDIDTLTAYFYSSSESGPLNSDEDGLHYTNNSCNYNVGDGSFNCSVSLPFYSAAGAWRCTVYVNDSASNLVHDTDGVTVSSLIAIDIPDSTFIDFGGMVVGESKTNSSLFIPVYNLGNVPIDLNLDAWSTGSGFDDVNSLNCTTGNIPVANFRVSSLLDSYISYFSLVSTGYYLLDFDLNPQSSGSLPTNKSLFVGLKIPDGVQGACTGVISVLGVTSS